MAMYPSSMVIRGAEAILVDTGPAAVDHTTSSFDAELPGSTVPKGPGQHDLVELVRTHPP